MEDFRENILDGAILVYNYHFEQSVCNLTKRRILPLVFSGKIFKNEGLCTAAPEQFKKAAGNVIQFLTIKVSFSTCYNVTLDVKVLCDLQVLKNTKYVPIILNLF